MDVGPPYAYPLRRRGSLAHFTTRYVAGNRAAGDEEPNRVTSEPGDESFDAGRQRTVPRCPDLTHVCDNRHHNID
jgi:hypothetical protein